MASQSKREEESRTDSLEASHVDVVRCQDCGKDVPLQNLAMHQLRACNARARRPEPNGDSMPPDENDSIDDGRLTPMDIDSPDEDTTPTKPSPATAAARAERGPVRRRDEDESNGTPRNGIRRRRARRLFATENDGPHLQFPNTDEVQILDAPPQIRQRERSEENSVPQQDTGGILQVSDVIDLVDSPQQANNEATANNPSHQWSCPQCTLHNESTVSHCDACHFPNPNVEQSGNSDGSPLGLVGGGALMGGLLGAAGSFMRGGSPFSGATEGAMTGLMGGTLINGVLQNDQASLAHISNGPTRQPLTVAQARSSSSLTGGYPSMGTAGGPPDGNARMRPRSSLRVVHQNGNNGRMSTLVMGGNSATRVRRRSERLRGGRASASFINEDLLGLLLHSYVQDEEERRAHNGPTARRGGNLNVDQMTYDELIEAFGDGTENLGATEQQIQQLPAQRINDPEKELPEDSRQCLICLEDFASGEERKILPCLHGFHAACCDRWLQTNGSCPICKHRVR